MKKIRDLNASIAHLRALLDGDVTGPEQREAVRRAIGKLKRLRRNPSPTKADIFRCVREVTETLLRVFSR